MANLYDFHDTKRHDKTDEELFDRLTDCLWEICVIADLLDLDYNELVTSNRDSFLEEQERFIKETDKELWLEAFFNENIATKQ
jgi:hypothetical protein